VFVLLNTRLRLGLGWVSDARVWHMSNPTDPLLPPSAPADHGADWSAGVACTVNEASCGGDVTCPHRRETVPARVPREQDAPAGSLVEVMNDASLAYESPDASCVAPFCVGRPALAICARWYGMNAKRPRKSIAALHAVTVTLTSDSALVATTRRAGATRARICTLRPAIAGRAVSVEDAIMEFMLWGGAAHTHTARVSVSSEPPALDTQLACGRGPHVVLGCGQNTKHQALTLPAAASVASPSTAPYPHSHGGRRCRQVRVCASWLADLPSPAASTCTTRTALHARRQGQATTDPAGRGEGDGLAPARTTQRCQEHGREIS
jgi:hypothetical protein